MLAAIPTSQQTHFTTNPPIIVHSAARWICSLCSDTINLVILYGNNPRKHEGRQRCFGYIPLHLIGYGQRIAREGDWSSYHDATGIVQFVIRQVVGALFISEARGFLSAPLLGAYSMSVESTRQY